jgi:hypothetical protein
MFALTWTAVALRHADLSCSLLPCITTDLDIWVDTSTSWRIGLTVGDRWAAWCLSTGWHRNGDGRDIGWAETVAIEVVALWIHARGTTGAHVHINTDNTGVIFALARAAPATSNIMMPSIAYPYLSHQSTSLSTPSTFRRLRTGQIPSLTVRWAHPNRISPSLLLCQKSFHHYCSMLRRRELMAERSASLLCSGGVATDNAPLQRPAGQRKPRVSCDAQRFLAPSPYRPLVLATDRATAWLTPYAIEQKLSSHASFPTEHLMRLRQVSASSVVKGTLPGMGCRNPEI